MKSKHRISIWLLLSTVAILAAVPWAAPGIGSARADSPPITLEAERIEPLFITLPVRQSSVVKPPWPVARVAVGDPTIADVKVLSPNELMLLGKSIGSTDLLLWGPNEQMVKWRIDVTVDYRQVQKQLNTILPGADLTVGQAGGVLTITGTLRRAEHADQLHRFLDAIAVRYVDLSSVAGVQQVMIRVRMAEVSRRAVRALGVNTLIGGNDFFGGITIGPDMGGPLNPISIGPLTGASAAHGVPFIFNRPTGVSPAVTLFGGIPNSDIEFFVQALHENQYMRILAEPSLIAASGQEASFLAGGEYPIPVVQGSGGSVSTSITIEYREYGVRLNFKPTVLGDGTIRLSIAPEVSQLSDIGAVVIEGFRVPSLIMRKAKTELELKSGQTFAMAGLLSRVATARNSRIPGIGDLPVLGALFRSTRYQSDETELLVLVTATLVEPLNKIQPMLEPGMLHTEPNDWEFYIEGRLQSNAPARLSNLQATRLRELGLGDLVGPGAWASYDQPAAKSQAPLQADKGEFVNAPATPAPTNTTSNYPE